MSSPLNFLVVDDHEAILEGTVPAIQKQYPEAEIFTAQERQTAERIIASYAPVLIVLDLSIPERPQDRASPAVGLALLQTLLKSDLAPNILVLSTDIHPLVRLKSVINGYGGGFAAADKSAPIREMLQLVATAMRGSVFLPSTVRSRPEFDAKWLRMLKLKFEDGLTDKAISKQMALSERTIRNYWVRIQDTLGIPDDPDHDLRVQIEITARDMGLIH
jgi:DNA-binding NarL/FixJ family response regulator